MENHATAMTNTTFLYGIISFGEADYTFLAGNALVILGVFLVAYFSFSSKAAETTSEENKVTEKKSYAEAAKTGATKKTPTKKTPSKKAAVSAETEDDD